MIEDNLEIINNDEVGKYDRLPMDLRMPFQKFIFQKLGIEDDVERVLIDGKIISDYIDNTKNRRVRELIQKRKFEEAADIVITEIQKVENLSKAA